jgi:hypothetical protein
LKLPASVRVALLAFAFGGTFAACQYDYRFDTHARYEAPQSGYRLDVRAAGVVLAGDDLSRRSGGEVTISPSASAGSVVTLNVGLPDALPNRSEIDRRLREAGYDPVAEEVAETEHAIGGALAGPKATLMEGQTKTLRVLEVRFRR